MVKEVSSVTSLTTHDLEKLAQSYIPDKLAEQAGLFRVDSADGAQLMGKSGSGDYSGIVFPYIWPGAERPREYRLRRDRPELEQTPEGRKEKNKYLSPPGRGNLFYVPPGTPAEALPDTTVPVVITEGEKKALALFRYFAEREEKALVIALPGVWNWRGTVGKVTDEKGRRDVKGVIPDFGRVAWSNRTAYIIFDSNVATNESVRAARRELARELVRRGAEVKLVDLPQVEGINGVDDLLGLKGPEFVSTLFEGATDSGIAAPPTVEMLEEEPLEMRRPLALLDGHALAAAWPHVRVTTKNTTDRKGNTITHNPPIVHEERRMLIVRDDGETFADFTGHSPLAEAGFSVSLSEIPPGEKLWSVRGVKSFINGDRPEPAEVFGKIVDTVDRFIDFDRSLADQRTSCELVGCYIMATWFLDAFTVVGFLWPNGEKGSGKTQLLTIVAELSYLGQVILAGGSFAALRDLADYGAFLAFDDAENLSDPQEDRPRQAHPVTRREPTREHRPAQGAYCGRRLEDAPRQHLLSEGVLGHQVAGSSLGEPHHRRPAHPHARPLPGERRGARLQTLAAPAPTLD